MAAAALLGGLLVVLALVGPGVPGLAGGSEAPPPEDSLPLAGASAGSVPGAAAGPTSTTTGAVTELVVHAAGAVRRPGLYRLPAGARVDDLVAAAGGLADDADADRINLALPLVDGERVYLPAVGEEVLPEAPGPAAPAEPAATGAAGTGAPVAPVNINTADAAELETLPGVGPVTAAAIVAHRDQSGPFSSVDDLLAVQGIGEAKLAALRDQVVV
jgi:competence protein ComEA